MASTPNDRLRRLRAMRHIEQVLSLPSDDDSMDALMESDPFTYAMHLYVRMGCLLHVCGCTQQELVDLTEAMVYVQAISAESA